MGAEGLSMDPLHTVIPAKAGTHLLRFRASAAMVLCSQGGSWVPAFAGMTVYG